MQVFTLIIVMVILTIGYFLLNKWIINSRFGKKMEVVFYLNEHDAKKSDKILKSLLLADEDSTEFTYNMWLYFDGIEYKWGSPKHIMNKGQSIDVAQDSTPYIWLATDCKTINISITTDMGKEAFSVGNIPIYKWFMLTLVVKEQTADLYINGKLERTYGMKGWMRSVQGDLWITQNEGFNGKLQNVRLFINALSPLEIDEMYKNGRNMGMKFNFLPSAAEIATVSDSSPNENRTRPTGTPATCIIPPPGGSSSVPSEPSVPSTNENNTGGHCDCPDSRLKRT
jgi:hypothetical protein